MSINSILTKFAQQYLVLSYTDVERAKIISSINYLENILYSRLSGQVVEIIRFGSFTRNTILPRKYDPNSDIDLMVVFDNKVQHTPETYRKWLLKVISSAYPNSVSEKDFPSIKLELGHIKFDLVPAYSQDSIFLGKRYFIPAKYGRWMQSTPNDINTRLQTKNQQCGNNLVRNTIRLCKHWNASAGYPFESYLMETQILNMSFLFANDTYDGFVSALYNLAKEKPNVKRALNYIYEYQKRENVEKQLFWLKKLLPGLNTIV